MNQSSSLKQRQSDIINGYTKICFNNKLAYIKHLDNFISADTEEQYNNYLSYALKQGLSSKEDKLKQLKINGSWTDKDENSLDENKKFASKLKITKSKMFLKADLESIKNQIISIEKTVKNQEDKKNNLIGYTAEEYAHKKTNNFFIYNSCFKDKNLNEHFYSYDEFEELDDDELSCLISEFNKYNSFFSENTLKKVALLPSYLNYFYLCNEDPYIFYGKPVSRLTFYQAETFSHAKYFKYIMSEAKGGIPEDIKADPDKMIEWFESNKNVENLLKKHDGKDNLNVSLVGATKEDLENLGLKSSGKQVNLAEMAAKKGGVLDISDLLKIQAL